jgi:hypothetical protein
VQTKGKSLGKSMQKNYLYGFLFVGEFWSPSGEDRIIVYFMHGWMMIQDLVEMKKKAVAEAQPTTTTLLYSMGDDLLIDSIDLLLAEPLKRSHYLSQVSLCLFFLYPVIQIVWYEKSSCLSLVTREY